jgi:hypothetical protein
LLRRLGLDPASASAPFVATLVDVTGLIIYFSVASIILRGTLLAEAATTKQIVQRPLSAIEWTPMAPGAPILASNGWRGTGGSHCEFARFPRGFSEPKHFHTNDLHAVVLEGQWGAWAPGAAEQYVSAGGYQFISGGTEHLSKCGPTTDCVVYDCGPASFDIQGLAPVQ